MTQTLQSVLKFETQVDINTPLAKAEIAADLLANLSPVFLNSVELYSEICDTSRLATEELNQLVVSGDTQSLQADRVLMDHYVHKVTTGSFNESMANEYIRRENLRAEAALKNDADVVIRKEGEALIGHIKERFPLGPQVLGGNFYFLEADPRLQQYPGRINLYRIAAGDSKPVRFGEEMTVDADSESFARALPGDITRLVQDLQHQIVTPATESAFSS